jgi:16S rRNA (cytosine967-C5)-methyltransferase
VHNLDEQPGQGPNDKIAPARACAYAVVRRVFEQEAWADRALHGEARRLGLDSRDLALATQLSFGTVQRVSTLDYVIQSLTRRPVTKLDPPVLAALRLGIFQLAFLDRIPAHAAVGESVELAKADSPRGAGLVNAVLRRAVREARPLIDALSDRTPGQASLLHSHPEWITRLWWHALGADTTRALMAADNEPAEAALRANTLRIDATALAARLPVATSMVEALPEALVLDAPFDTFSAPEWRDGLLMPQSRAAMAVSRALAPQPGDRVLDLCAAPGGKTTHLAALMGGEGEIVAVERHEGRAAALRATCERMKASIVEVRVGDAKDPPVEGEFDRILVDPPCTGLGTLRSHPDLRWRVTSSAVERLAGEQDAILAAARRHLRPGGRLVYSVCTLSPGEERLAGDVQRRLWPHEDGSDGFYIAADG